MANQPAKAELPAKVRDVQMEIDTINRIVEFRQMPHDFAVQPVSVRIPVAVLKALMSTLLKVEADAETQLIGGRNVGGDVNGNVGKTALSRT